MVGGVWLVSFSIGVGGCVLSGRKLVIRVCDLLEWMLVFLLLGLRVLVWVTLGCVLDGVLLWCGGELGLGCSVVSSGWAV